MIYLVRHGQTDWNKLKVMQGRTDIPLNEKGIEQAKVVGEKLRGINFDAIFYSPLLRAKQTMQNLGVGGYNCGRRKAFGKKLWRI